MSTRYDTGPGSKSADQVEREVQQIGAPRWKRPSRRFRSACRRASCSTRPWATCAGAAATRSCAISGATVRDNPVPIVLMSTGLAWLMLVGATRQEGATTRTTISDDYLSSGTTARATIPATIRRATIAPNMTTTASLPAAHFGATAWPAGEAQGRAGTAFAERADETAEAARREAQDLGAGGHEHAPGLSEGGGETAPSWGAEARATAQEWSAGARSAVTDAGERARRLGAGCPGAARRTPARICGRARAVPGRPRRLLWSTRVRRSFFDTLARAAAGPRARWDWRVGAAIGAALPATETEDEWMGDTRDRLKDRATDAGAASSSTRRERPAAAAYEAARDEADRQGLTAGRRHGRGRGGRHARPSGSPRRRPRRRRPKPSARSSDRPRTRPV